MLKSGFEMKIQMRRGYDIAHSVLVTILTFSCQYNRLCFAAFRIPGGYIWCFLPLTMPVIYQLGTIMLSGQ